MRVVGGGAPFDSAEAAPDCDCVAVRREGGAGGCAKLPDLPKAGFESRTTGKELTDLYSVAD